MSLQINFQAVYTSRLILRLSSLVIVIAFSVPLFQGFFQGGLLRSNTPPVAHFS